ncbi:WD40 repeat-like protein [Pholiota conissans]|uniref:WD40 repeat-like protein n=1 Tax=Pholiota conissans TaxID=109636 RepID=A0A9P5Z183_9AGAR|nr:WD40 repeat-like protein [Pholiota conissans]
MSGDVGPVYNHRPMQPTAIRTSTTPGVPQGRASLFDSIDAIKTEYKLLHAELDGVRNERDELEMKLKSQLAELNSVRSALYELEVHHSRVLARYEEEAHQLQAERDQRFESGRVSEGSLPAFLRPSPHNPDSSNRPLSAEAQARSLPRIDRPHSSSSLARIDMLKTSRPIDGDADRNLERPPDNRAHKRPRTGRDHPDSYPPPPMGAQSQNASSSSSAMPVPSPNSLGLYRSPDVSSGREPAERTLPEREQLQKEPPRYPVPPEIPDRNDWQVVYNPRVQKALGICLVHTFAHTSVVCCIRFSPDGKLLATGCKGSTHLYNVLTGEKVCILSDPDPAPAKGSQTQTKDYYIRSVKFSPDGKLLATGSEDNEIRIWDIDARKIIRTLKGHTEEIYSLDFSRNGRYIVSGSADRTLWIWDLRQRSSKMIHLSKDSQDFEQGITSIAISPDSKLVAAGCMDTIVRLYDIETVELVDTLHGHENSVYSVSFTPDGRGLITGSLDKQLRLWNIMPILQNQANPPSATVRRQYPIANCPCISFKGHNDFVLSTAITPDSRWIISGSKDRSVSFWDARNADLQFTLQGHKNSVIALHTSPLGGMLATGSGDATARIWSFSSV